MYIPRIDIVRGEAHDKQNIIVYNRAKTKGKQEKHTPHYSPLTTRVPANPPYKYKQEKSSHNALSEQKKETVTVVVGGCPLSARIKSEAVQSRKIRKLGACDYTIGRYAAKREYAGHCATGCRRESQELEVLSLCDSYQVWSYKCAAELKWN